MKPRRRITFILFVTLASLLWFAARIEQTTATSGEHSCCHTAAQESGQSDEPGNPGHKKPEANCSHKPKAGEVQCHCRRMEDCSDTDGGKPTVREHIACKSFCFKDFCTCPVIPCA